MINLKVFLSLLLITLIGGFLRFYLLDKYSVQLNHDEVSQLFDTSSIVSTGRDIYGNFLPLAFPSTGEYKVGHYIYITVLFYLLFGLQEVTVRLPAAFFGTLIVPAVFLFINQITKNTKLALISSLVIAFTPSEIFYSRKSFENVIGIFFLFTGLFFLIRQLEKNKPIWSLLTALFLVLPMYLYTSHTIVVPLILIAFTILYWKKIKPVTSNFKLTFLAWGILLLPLLYITLTNSGIRFRASTVSVFQDRNLIDQINNINEDQSPYSIIFLPKVILEHSFTKYLKQLDVSRIFGNGLDFTNQGLLGVGPLMLIQLPFFFLGIILILKSKFFSNNGKFLLILLVLAVIPSGATFEDFSPHRSVFAFSIMSIVSSFGLYEFLEVISKKINLYPRLVIMFVLGILFLLNITYLVHMYTVNLPFEKSQYIHYPYKDVALYAWSQYKNYDNIIIDPVYGQFAPSRAVAVHYYLAYYGNYSTTKFQEDLQLNKTGIYFDKFSIREIDWRKDKFLLNTLIIASPWSIPMNDIDKQKITKTFYFYDGQDAFYAIRN